MLLDTHGCARQMTCLILFLTLAIGTLDVHRCGLGGLSRLFKAVRRLLIELDGFVLPMLLAPKDLLQQTALQFGVSFVLERDCSLQKVGLAS